MEDVNRFQGQIMDASTVAEVGYRALIRGKRVAVPGIGNQITAFASRFLPRRMVTKTTKNMMTRA
jgi:short-subunit dehydrogenase